MLGDAAYNMQVSDCHWLRPRESPTNRILFPFSALKKTLLLNLHGFYIYKLRIYIWNCQSRGKLVLLVTWATNSFWASMYT